MPVSSAFAILAALVAVVCVAALVGRRVGRRARRVADTVPLADDVVAASVLGREATLVQFSTQLCGQCPSVHRTIEAIVADRDGVTSTEIDLTDDPETARRLSILRTPTVFILGPTGVVRARFAGPTPRAALEAELDRLRERADV